jgi:hypothetical protein
MRFRENKRGPSSVHYIHIDNSQVKDILGEIIAEPTRPSIQEAYEVGARI